MRPAVEEKKEEEEREETRPNVEEELVLMEQKWKEQCIINETLKQRLANEEERFRMQMSERACEVADLKRSLALALRDKEQLLEELQRYVCRQREQEARSQGSEVRQTMVLRYPLPYPQEPCPPPLVPQQPPELRFGNPYSSDTKECVDAAVSPDLLPLPPPEPCAPPLSPSSPASAAGPGAPGWAQEVVCIQPCRSTSPRRSATILQRTLRLKLRRRPERTPGPPSASTPGEIHWILDRSSGGGSEVHRRCPLCELIFPPHFEQSSFEQHVESHWKVCPVCSEQFPLHCQQRHFETHVLTHFDGHVLNFHQTD
ncbi:hypothetical protein WMY93_019421 [Mugilogobius chulae]|uniref:UBZ1-type domain-containing protein n=1 Tax=Mugilogobius chulae TaxID=88201 RepID=A0AAW0NFH6_9GOBI